MPKHRKKKRTTLQTKLEIQSSVRKELKNPSAKSSPGVKARAANIRRTGQAVPVTTGGKPDKRNPLQTASDRRKKRFANKQAEARMHRPLTEKEQAEFKDIMTSINRLRRKRFREEEAHRISTLKWRAKQKKNRKKP